MKPLEGKVAVVTGASRGAGRGIAVELGAAGATVYVTGRSTREGKPETYGRLLAEAGLPALPGTIDDTAEAATEAGGRGIAARCDHTREDEVRALFARVEREQGRLDVLVNNAWGGHEALSPKAFGTPFWEQPLDQWDAMMDRGVRSHLLAARCAAPLFVRQRRGLVIATTFWDRGRYIAGNLFYDLAKAGIARVALGVAEELRPYGVASVALSPGFMRTELVLGSRDEARWQEDPSLARTESTRYVGRAVVAMVMGAGVLRRSGEILYAGELARAYGFTDVDGRQPPPFAMP